MGSVHFLQGVAAAAGAKIVRLRAGAGWARAACCVVLAVAVACARCGAGETGRQREILRELAAFRPDWVAGDGEWMLEVWDTDLGLEALVPLPAGDDNAAAKFFLLEECYPDEKGVLGKPEGAKTRGVAALLDAAEMGTCRLIPEYYPVFDTTTVKQPDFGVMREYLQALLGRAESAVATGNQVEAKRCYRAALICGRHLTRDKSSTIVFSIGLLFKLHGAKGLARCLTRFGEHDKARLADEYAARVAVWMRALTWKANVALSETADFACLPAVVRVARHDAEAFWRKEAVVRLATLRYGVPDFAAGTVARDPAFEMLADATLSEVASADPDASIRRLAVWAAKNIRPQDYAGLRHVFP